MYKNNNLRKNGSGCSDPTAYEAIKNVERKRKEAENVNFHSLLHDIFDLCDEAGYKVHGRIVLQNKETGHMYK